MLKTLNRLAKLTFYVAMGGLGAIASACSDSSDPVTDAASSPDSSGAEAGQDAAGGTGIHLQLESGEG